MPTWGTILLAVLGLVLRLAYKAHQKKVKDDKIMEEAPDAPDDERADFDERERLQESNQTRPKS